MLRQGAFVPLSDFADLSRGNRPLEDPLPEFWLPLPAVPKHGWGRALRGWRPLGEVSSLELRRRTRGEAELYLELHRRSTAAVEPITAEVVYEGAAIGRLVLQSGTARGRYRMPGEAARNMDITLRFEPPIEQPVGGPQEIALRSVGLLPPGAEPPRRDRFSSFDEAGRAIRFLHPGSLVTPLHLPRDAGRLRLEIDARAAAPTDDSPLGAYVLDATGARVAAAGPISDSGSVTIPLQAVAGSPVFLVIEVPPGQLTIQRPVLELEAGSSPRHGAAEARASSSPARRPDVLLVVLDAARGDRFLPGAQRRQTVPNLDQVAAEAIAFERAWSECPTTSCSIPNLITGVSFQPVGDAWRGPPLAEEATTLAEYLRRAGYRTVGYSANPSNSKRLNHAQGFDVFEELWGDHPHRGPHGMSDLAVRAIANQPDEQPIFLQLHYLPPHAPYAPLLRFDRFTDPDYEGPVHPFMDLKPYESGVEQLPPADLEQLVGLYDGNLMMADDAVGRVIEALKAAGRWPRTLVVVTSDHGEAFMEHGVWGHNTTLHEEMLHVPLIVRLPGGEVPPAVDTKLPAGLLDVVPTVLARLGLQLEEDVSGVDLLAASPGSRFLFHRTSSLRWPQLAVRSADWKLIAWPRIQRQELFYLADDPGETENLAATRPLLYAGFGLLVRQHLERTLLQRQAGEQVAPSAEEAEALRALGYVD